MLGERDGAARAVSGDLNAQDELGLTQISQLEALAKLCNNAVQCLSALGGKGHVINVHRDNHVDVIPGVDVDGPVSLQVLESHLQQSLMQLEVPLPSSLLQAIERLLEETHHVWTSNMEALWLAHVDLRINIAVEEGVGDVDEAKMIVLASSEREDGANGLKTRRASEDLEVVEARALAEALSNETRLVAIDRAVRVALELEDPARANIYQEAAPPRSKCRCADALATRPRPLQSIPPHRHA